MNKSEQMRLWAWRVRVIREAASSPRNIASTCRRFGISRQAYYRWKRRFDAHGEARLVGSDQPTESIAHRHATRGGEQESVSSTALPLWPRQDRGLPVPISSAVASRVIGASDSPAARDEPVAGEPEASCPCEALAALREGAAWFSSPTGCQVSRAHSGHAEALVSVYGHR